MEQIVLLVNEQKRDVAEALHSLEPWLRERTEVRVETDLAAEWDGEEVGCAVVLGGDGTMLHAARKFAPAAIPIIGINIGKLGFLTETTVPHARQTLTEVLEGRFRVVELMMMECTLERDGEVLHRSLVVNDAVISRTSLSRLLTIEFVADGEPMNTYRADGLIVATPVGSTAHSLAASGPILHPGLDAFIISPICPHTLSNRPIVLPPDFELEMTPRDFAERPALTVDGHIFSPLNEEDRVRVSKAEENFRLINTGRRTFFETLRDKLGWSGQPRYVR